MKKSSMDVQILRKKRKLISRKINKCWNHNIFAIFARIFIILMRNRESACLCLILVAKLVMDNRINALFARDPINSMKKLAHARFPSKSQFNSVKLLLMVSASNVKAYIIFEIIYAYRYLIRIVLNH